MAVTSDPDVIDLVVVTAPEPDRRRNDEIAVVVEILVAPFAIDVGREERLDIEAEDRKVLVVEIGDDDVVVS